MKDRELTGLDRTSRASAAECVGGGRVEFVEEKEHKSAALSLVILRTLQFTRMFCHGGHIPRLHCLM